MLQKDLEYWQIDELILEPCCALKYYPEIELCVKEQKGEQEAKAKETQRLKDSASKSSIRRFVITEKAPTRAFSWSYSPPSLMIIALQTQFHIERPWGQRPFSIVS